MAEDIEYPPPLMSAFTGLPAGEFPLYFAAAGTRCPRPPTLVTLDRRED